MSANRVRIQPGFHIRCSNCGAAMARLELPGFCVDRCDACGGVWLDASELDKVRAIKGGATTIDVGKRSGGGKVGTRIDRVCPRDGSGLRQTPHANQSHVVVDRCPTCLGVFLDAGELNDLSEHSLGERLRGFFAM